MTTEITPHDLADLLARLDQDELRAAFARAAGTASIAHWRVERDGTIAGCVGYAARKALIAVHFVDGAGRTGRVDLVLKHFAGWSGSGEIEQYRWLASLGAPVPRLAGAQRDAKGDQVLLIERLAHVGYDLAKDDEVAAVLSSLARLNALPIPSAGTLTEKPRTVAGMMARTLAEFPRLIADARAGLLGEEIRDIIVDGALLWPTLEAYLAPAVAAIADLPVGLMHGDAAPQNVGWRSGRHEAVLFDLHSLHCGCILSDLMVLIDGMDDRDDRLTRHWLAALHRAGGPALGEAATRRARSSYGRILNIGGVHWRRSRCIDGMVDWTADRDEGRRSYRRGLGSSLHRLRAELAQASRYHAATGGAS